MNNEAIGKIYGSSAHSLIDHLDFLVSRATGLTAAGWDLVPLDNGVQMIVPVAGSAEAKEKFDLLDHRLNFRKAAQRSTEGMASVGATEEDCPALWEVGKLMTADPEE